jgi:glucosamine--fructose-6-phosphate aminotransferase (isomerizing)
MKHGPIALIDENMPIVIIAPKVGHYDKLSVMFRKSKQKRKSYRNCE